MISFDPTSPYRKAAIVLAIVLALLGCYVFGRHDGYTKAEALGDAKYAKLEAAQEAANRLASDTARRIVDAEIIRRDELARELAAARTTIAEQGKKITNRRIADASLSVTAVAGRCTFGPGWVGLYNEALGFGVSAGGHPAAAPGAAGEAAGVPATEAGEFQQGGVTPEDVQITHRDNALLCRDIKAKYLKLIKWAEGIPKTVNATEAR
ncbi:MAG: hypothetical protein CVU73_12165 [Deltaproteobacteria bacterium HGW-Deltaproteobacteria-8]|jgi:hypothetical protein|nr:MAG: hypothetical protein CVU73_12165 [Deltaproteobacteria bacterium HGW-Deltaproteobacteria-8]